VDGGPVRDSGNIVGRVFTIHELRAQAKRMRGLRLPRGTQ